MSKGGGNNYQYAPPSYTNQNSVTNGTTSQQQSGTQSQQQQAQALQQMLQNSLSNTSNSQQGVSQQNTTGSNTQNSTQQGVTQSDIPLWLQQAAQYGVGNARQLMQNANSVYGGELSTGMTPEQMAAGRYYQQGVNQASPYFDQARSFLSGAANRPGDVSAQTFANGLSGVGAYMNPYISNVVDSVSRIGQQNLDKALTQTADQAISARAFGGSRHGVQEGVATAQNNLNTNNLISQLMSSGYDKASSLLGQDIGNNFQSQMANQNAAQNYNQTQLGVGNAMAGLGNTAQNAYLQGVNALMGYGNQAQQTGQSALDRAYQQWQYQQQMPMQLQQLYNSTVGTAPHGTTQTSSQTGSQVGSNTQNMLGNTSQTGLSSTQAQQLGLGNTSSTGSSQGQSASSMIGTQTGNTNTAGWSMSPQQQQSSSPLMTGLGLGMAGLSMLPGGTIPGLLGGAYGALSGQSFLPFR